MASSASIELVKLSNEAERVRDERRETARRERGKLYGDLLAVIVRLEGCGWGPRESTDQEFEDANRAYELLHQRVFLEGTEQVQAGVIDVTTSLSAIGEQMHRFGGRTAASYRAAYQERARSRIRGDAITDARGRLIVAMRDDVTAPHLPAPPSGAASEPA